MLQSFILLLILVAIQVYSFSFQVGLMPNGAEYIAGGQVIVERVHRTHAGDYQCVVNNNNNNIGWRKKVII